MGVCICLSKFSGSLGLPGPSQLEYPRSTSVRLKRKEGKRTFRDRITFSLPPPVIQSSTPLTHYPGWASICVIPGLDPRGLITKPCQDLCFMEVLGSSRLLGLFDGHGREGHRVVERCRSFAASFYINQQQRLKGDGERFLYDLAVGMDENLKEGDVNVAYSGTTLVLLLLTLDTVYFASVGDSRAILATTSEPDSVTHVQPPRGDDKELMERLKCRRSVSVDKSLTAVQMTKDHKPEDPEEKKRITDMGGIVSRVTDAEGKDVGPWRVWQKQSNHPGLAMSRSVGDAVGHTIGVTCSPTVSSHTLKEESDYFLVAGSDGIWDVMENQEVVDFVEAYRHSSLRGEPLSSKETHSRPNNSCIARLLCEEARARWIYVVEAEDVLIDDISCAVIELKDSAMHYILPPDRILTPKGSGKTDLDEEPSPSSVPIATARMRDPRRNSMNDEDE